MKVNTAQTGIAHAVVSESSKPWERFAYRRAASAAREDEAGRTMSERLLIIQARVSNRRGWPHQGLADETADKLPNPMVQ